MMNKKTIEAMTSSKSGEWETPKWLFDELDAEFHFTLDPCSTHNNAKCKKHYTQEENGLLQDWSGETVFCNPPYSRSTKKSPGQVAWVRKCYEESRKKNTTIDDRKRVGKGSFSQLCKGWSQRRQKTPHTSGGRRTRFLLRRVCRRKTRFRTEKAVC